MPTMEMRFRLFVQQHRDGRFTVRVLRVPHVSAYAKTRSGAFNVVRDKLRHYLKQRSQGSLGDLTFQEAQELRPLEVEVIPTGEVEQDPIAITVSLLITAVPGPRGPRYVVSAPRVDDFHLSVVDAAEIEERARIALAKFLRKWSPLDIAEVSRTGVEELDVITLELPEPEEVDERRNSRHTDDDEDSQSVLQECGVNLTALAQEGRLGRADHRDALVDLIIATIATNGKSSVMLVGRSGVGKTALVHEVVERIRAGNVPKTLLGRDVWFVTANNLIAGMKYTGEWQGRTKQFMTEARASRPILFMGDPNAILDAGRWSKSDNNMGRFLRPAIESGDLTVICECTPEGYAAGQSFDPSFMGAFRRIDIVEPDVADVQAIVQAEARRLESSHRIRIEPTATDAVLELTRRFMPYRAFPGKAVRFLETLVGDALTTDNHQHDVRVLQRSDAVGSFTRMSGLPASILSDDIPLSEPSIRSYFQNRLLGQPDAVDALVDLVMLLKAGLNDPSKPLGSLFFVGPTGVGKTESAKVLAEYLFGNRDRMIRFDMSEYAGNDALPRLIGSAWDSDSKGELTRRVREQPFGVVLLDEVEKAHSDVFDALLGVLGEGRLTDARGETTDFRNSIIIMTSNLGASRREMQPVGFRQTGPTEAETVDRLRAHFVQEAERFFRPEFFNRIDRIVAFQPLNVDAMRLITRRELGKLLMREGIVRRNLLVEIEDAVIEQLVANGFHPQYGARPLQRQIERLVVLPLARLLVNRRPDHRHMLYFGVRDSQIQLRLVPIEAPDDTPVEPVRRTVEPGRVDADLAQVHHELEGLRERIAAEEVTPVVQMLRRQMSALLTRTHEPTFWDEPAEAREILGQVYHLDRVLKRLDALAERAERLREKGRHIRLHRDRRELPEHAEAVRRLAEEFTYLQLELAGAGTGRGRDLAVVRVTPVGQESVGWAVQVLEMYASWARRKGYEFQALDGRQPREERAAPGGLATLPETGALVVRGSNVYELLREEAGLHRLTVGTAEDRRRFLARVSVAQLEVAEAGDGLADLLGTALRLAATGDRLKEGNTDDLAIVRVYSRGRQQFVRDPRTGVRVTNLAAVLEEGQIDPFLLASLRRLATENVAAHSSFVALQPGV